MKRPFLGTKTGVFLICILAFGNAFAQEQKISFYVGGGTSLPLSPDEFSDFWGPKFNLGAGIGYSLGEEGRMSLLGYFNFNRFSLDEDKVLAAAGVPSGAGVSFSGGSVDVLTISANLKVSTATDAKAAPYLLGGLGFFRLSATDITAVGGGQTFSQGFNETESKLGIGLGAGLDISLNERAGLFLELKYNIGFTEGDKVQYLPIKVGLSFR